MITLRLIVAVGISFAASNARAITTGFETLPLGQVYAANSFVYAGDVNLKVTGSAFIGDRDEGTGVNKWLEQGSGSVEFQLPATVSQLSLYVIGGTGMFTNSVRINGMPGFAEVGFEMLNGQTVGGVAISVASNVMTLNGPIHTFRISSVEFAIDDVFINAPTPTADFDGDGDADGDDFLRWQRGLGLAGSAGPSNGDADFDNDVDAVDLINWRGRFGRTSGAVAPATQVAPEPCGSTTLFALLFAMRRRRV